MRLEDFRFRLTDKRTGASAIMSFYDLCGCGEGVSVLVRGRSGIPNQMWNEEINYEGYKGCGLRPDWDIEVMEPGAANPVVEARGAFDLLEKDFAPDPSTHCIAISADQRVVDELNRRERTMALLLKDEGGPRHGFRPLNAWQVANFLHRASRGPDTAGRIVVAHPLTVAAWHSGIDRVADAVVAAAMVYYGLDDMPLWTAPHPPDPCVFKMLIDALGIGLTGSQLSERIHAQPR